MSYSEIAICNLALTMLGADSIRSFDEDNKRARMMKNLFNFSRDFLLTQLDWTFAKGYVELQQLDLDVDDTPEGMEGYQVPADCLVANDIAPKGSNIYWLKEGNIIYTNQSPTWLHYTKKITDVNLFSLSFINVLSAYLSYRAAPAIVTSSSMIGQMRDGYLLSIQESYPIETSQESAYKSEDGKYVNDTFVFPDGNADPEDESRWLEAE